MSKVDVDAFFGFLVSILDKWVNVLPSRECEWQVRERGISIFSMLIFMSLYRCRQICVTSSGELVNSIIVAEDSAKIVGPVGYVMGVIRMYKYTQRLETNFDCLPQPFSMIF